MVIVTWKLGNAAATLWRAVYKNGDKGKIDFCVERQVLDATGVPTWLPYNGDHGAQMGMRALMLLTSGKVEAHQEAIGRLGGVPIIDLGVVTL